MQVRAVDGVTIETRDVWFGDVRIPLVVSYPSASETPLPALICVHGHGGSARVIAGLAATEAEWEQTRRYRYDFARQFAVAGFLTVAYDVRGFGERPFVLNRPNHDPCDFEFLRLALTGSTLLGWHVWDLSRVIDYVEHRDDVRMGAIGCAGVSLGGTIAIFGGALDVRLKAVGVFAALNHYRRYAIQEGHFCGAQILPGLLAFGELPDVAALIAPRALWVEHGDSDTTFPLDDAIAAIEEVRSVYDRSGVSDRFGSEVFQGGHRFEIGGSVPFLWRMLTEARDER